VDCGGVYLQAAAGNAGVGGNGHAAVGLPTGVRIGVGCDANTSAFVGVERAAANTGTHVGARFAAALAASVELG
jgi:hypothetical protein